MREIQTVIDSEVFLMISEAVLVAATKKKKLGSWG
jgi:hypothetical protein